MTQCPFKPLLDFEKFAAGTPHAVIGSLRSAHRILWEEDEFATGGHWLLFQQRDIDHVLQSPALFTSNLGPLLDDFPAQLLAEQQESLTFMDPPRHRQYRTLVEPAFRQTAMRQREPMMRALPSSILDEVLPRGQCEFVAEVAMQLPTRVIFAVMGVPAANFARVAELTNTLALADDPEFAENRQAGFIASGLLMQYGTELAASHRRAPRDSLTMTLLGSQAEGRKLSDVDFGRFFNNLIVGGTETTRNTLAGAMYEFIRHPEQYALLQQDPPGSQRGGGSAAVPQPGHLPAAHRHAGAGTRRPADSRRRQGRVRTRLAKPRPTVLRATRRVRHPQADRTHPPPLPHLRWRRALLPGHPARG